MHESDSIGLNVNIASMMIRRSLDSRFAEYGCTSGIQGRVLGVLANAEEKQQCIYQKDIEKLFGTRRSSINNLISNLESHGYVERIPDPADARLKQLKITDAGLLQHAKICDVLSDFEATLSGNFSQEEKEQLLFLLKRIIDYFHSDSENMVTEKEDFHA